MLKWGNAVLRTGCNSLKEVLSCQEEMEQDRPEEADREPAEAWVEEEARGREGWVGPDPGQVPAVIVSAPHAEQQFRTGSEPRVMT